MKNFFVVWRFYEGDREHLDDVLFALANVNRHRREFGGFVWLCIGFDGQFPEEHMKDVTQRIYNCHPAILIGGGIDDESMALMRVYKRACEWADSEPEIWWRFAHFNREPDFFTKLVVRDNVLSARACFALASETGKMRGR